MIALRSLSYVRMIALREILSAFLDLKKLPFVFRLFLN